MFSRNLKMKERDLNFLGKNSPDIENSKCRDLEARRYLLLFEEISLAKGLTKGWLEDNEVEKLTRSQILYDLMKLDKDLHFLPSGEAKEGL